MLWQKYDLTQNPRKLIAIVERAQQENNLIEFDEVLREIRVRQLTEIKTLSKVVIVASKLRGPKAGLNLMREFVFNGHFGKSFEEKIRTCATKSHIIFKEDVRKIYKEIQESEDLQTEYILAHYAALCVRKYLHKELKQFESDFKEISERPFVRAMTARALLQVKADLDLVWTYLQPLEETKLIEQKLNQFIWATFLSYYNARNEKSKLKGLLSRMNVHTLPQGMLHTALVAASKLGDVKKAEEVFFLMGPKAPRSYGTLIRTYAMAGDYYKAKRLFNSIHNKNEVDYSEMYTTLKRIQRPLRERKNFLLAMTEKGYFQSSHYVDLLLDYYSEPGKTSHFLKSVLIDLERVSKKKWSRNLFRVIKKICIDTKDSDLWKKILLKQRIMTERLISKYDEKPRSIVDDNEKPTVAAEDEKPDDRQPVDDKPK
jgi:pentatricopeptide repeat protein